MNSTKDYEMPCRKSSEYLELPEGVTLSPHPLYPEKYSGGSDGHVYCFSSARVNARKPRPFRIFEAKGTTGYYHAALVLPGGVRKTKPVHVLICEAFHGMRPAPKTLVRHLDGTKTNNDPINLAWGTFRDNEADKRKHGRLLEGERSNNVKLSSEAVRIIRRAIPAGLWTPGDAAIVFGVDPSTIRRIARGVGWRSVDHEGESIVESAP